MRQHIWIDVVKDYDCEILYRPRKANVVTDALRRNVVSTPTQGHYLRVTMNSILMDFIREAQPRGSITSLVALDEVGDNMVRGEMAEKIHWRPLSCTNYKGANGNFM